MKMQSPGALAYAGVLQSCYLAGFYAVGAGRQEFGLRGIAPGVVAAAGWNPHLGFGAGRNGEAHRQGVACNFPAQGDCSVGGLLRDVHPVDFLRNLRLDGEASVARGIFVGDNAAKPLIEPGADAVEAVVNMAAFAVPIFPCCGCAVVNHVEEARFVAFFEHREEIVGLRHFHGPFGNNRHTHEACGDMAVVFRG